MGSARLYCIKIRKRGRNYRDPGTETQEEQRALDERGTRKRQREKKRREEKEKKRQPRKRRNGTKTGDLKRGSGEEDELGTTTKRSRSEPEEDQKNLGR